MTAADLGGYGKPRRTDGFYHTTRWRKLRHYVLSREPLCRDPFGEHAE